MHRSICSDWHGRHQVKRQRRKYIRRGLAWRATVAAIHGLVDLVGETHLAVRAMRTRIRSEKVPTEPSEEGKMAAGTRRPPSLESTALDAMSVLRNLGYRQAFAEAAIYAVVQERGDQIATSDLVKCALKLAAQPNSIAETHSRSRQ